MAPPQSFKKGGVKKSVKKYIYSCYKGIEDKIIMNENDPTNLRPYEAFYIRKYKQSLKTREECSEFANLFF